MSQLQAIVTHIAAGNAPGHAWQRAQEWAKAQGLDQYELHVELDRDEGNNDVLYISTLNDPHVGIKGEQVSPDFNHLPDLSKWWAKYKSAVLKRLEQGQGFQDLTPSVSEGEYHAEPVSALASVVAKVTQAEHWGEDVKDLDAPRPSRMKKPKVTPQAHRVYKLYIQDLFKYVLADKYGKARAEQAFEWFIQNRSTAIYTVGQEIEDEKAQMYLDLGQIPPPEADYFKESYFAVWTRWIARPKVVPTPAHAAHTAESQIPPGQRLNAWHEGYQARQNGQGFSMNPYNEDTKAENWHEMHEHWWDGWHTANEEHQNARSTH